MNRLPVDKCVQIVNLLVEGVSKRAVCRVDDVSINSFTKLVEEGGAGCLDYWAQ